MSTLQEQFSKDRLGKTYANHQERIVHILSSAGVGYLNCFIPHYFDGNKEPADLVWIVGEVCILFYCTSGKKDFARQNAHNVKQAKRWLHAWHLGRKVVGQSGEKVFELCFQDIKYIICVSVTSAVDEYCALCDVHTSKDKAIPIFCIPEATLVHLLTNGGNITDLLNLFILIVYRGRITKSSTSRVIAKVCELGFRSGAGYTWEMPARTPQRHFHSILTSHLVKQIPVYNKSREALFSVIGLYEWAWMLGALHSSDVIIGPTVPGSFGPTFQVKGKRLYDIDIVIASAANTEILAKNATRIHSFGRRNKTFVYSEYYLFANNDTSGGVFAIPDVDSLQTLYLAAEELLAMIPA